MRIISNQNPKRFLLPLVGDARPPEAYSWYYLVQVVVVYKRELRLANFIAIVALLASVPISLLMPLMVDECCWISRPP